MENHLPLLETLPIASKYLHEAIDNSTTKATQSFLLGSFRFPRSKLAADAELLNKSLVTWLICAL